ncbi:hypothetical protein MsAm2_08960 [Methanolapillus ohkumae]|uniref:Uncharacterized protein n=2 Tax=Methanolapillus ohkumae TaxID=3028298 RepID=A0AA96V899_9EURY|nr:hypothetical protein MsAm2_08960 [Methanosarcinaceae archaeon Am2]
MTIVLGILGFIVLMIVVAAVCWYIGKRKFDRMNGLVKVKTSKKEKAKNEKANKKEMAASKKETAGASGVIPSISEDPKSGSKAEELTEEDEKIPEWKPPKREEKQTSVSSSESDPGTFDAAPAALTASAGSDASNLHAPSSTSSSDLDSYVPPKSRQKQSSASTLSSSNIPRDPSRPMDPDAKIGIVGSTITKKPAVEEDSEFIVPLKKGESQKPKPPVYDEPEKEVFETKNMNSSPVPAAPSTPPARQESTPTPSKPATSSPSEEKKKFNHKYSYFDTVMATEKESEPAVKEQDAPKDAPVPQKPKMTEPAAAIVHETKTSEEGQKKFIDMNVFEDDGEIQNESVAAKYTFEGDAEEELPKRNEMSSDSEKEKTEKKKDIFDYEEPEY